MNAKEWYAWNNLMPPKPDDLHVVGQVFVSNPGVQAQLLAKEPQGINPTVLLLDLHLVQQPGVWPQVMAWAQARYDRIIAPASVAYTEVEIFSDGQSIAKVPVDEVH